MATLARESHRRRYPKRDRARQLAQRAIDAGRLVRQPCVKCGASPAQAHHHDYDKPLDVEWLCRPCHAEAHRSEAAKARREAKVTRGEFPPIDVTCSVCGGTFIFKRTRDRRGKAQGGRVPGLCSEACRLRSRAATAVGAAFKLLEQAEAAERRASR